MALGKCIANTQFKVRGRGWDNTCVFNAMIALQIEREATRMAKICMMDGNLVEAAKWNEEKNWTAKINEYFRIQSIVENKSQTNERDMALDTCSFMFVSAVGDFCLRPSHIFSLSSLRRFSFFSLFFIFCYLSQFYIISFQIVIVKRAHGKWAMSFMHNTWIKDTICLFRLPAYIFDSIFMFFVFFFLVCSQPYSSSPKMPKMPDHYV